MKSGRQRVAAATFVFVGLVACSSGTTTTSSSGTPGPGGNCSTQECFAAVQCRKGDCSGPITSSGCCPCGAGYVDDSTCASDAGDASAQKSDCAPACAPSEVCVRPGACMFDARCVPRTSVTCPDSGLCSTQGCSGELKGAALECVCR